MSNQRSDENIDARIDIWSVLRVVLVVVAAISGLISVFSVNIGLDLGSLYGGVSGGVLVLVAAVLIGTSQIFFQQYFEMRRSKAALRRQLEYDQAETKLLRGAFERAGEAKGARVDLPTAPSTDI